MAKQLNRLSQTLAAIFRGALEAELEAGAECHPATSLEVPSKGTSEATLFLLLVLLLFCSKNLGIFRARRYSPHPDRVGSIFSGSIRKRRICGHV